MHIFFLGLQIYVGIGFLMLLILYLFDTDFKDMWWFEPNVAMYNAIQSLMWGFTLIRNIIRRIRRK